MHQEAPISAEVEEYLESICRIRDRGALATLTELARELERTTPSVLGMVRRMQEQGMVTYDRATGAVLTPPGQEWAARLRRRHRLAERLLTDLLGMPWDRVHDVACRFEHVIDEEVEQYLLAALDHPTTCPHGNPMGDTPEMPHLPLSQLAAGQGGRLCRILNETAQTLAYLNGMHLRPGAWVIVCAHAPDGGPLTVDVDGQRYALAREMADHLLVAPERGA